MILSVGSGFDQLGDVRVDISRGSSANFLSDAQKLPFQDQSFDIVVSISVIEHIPNWSQALKEIFRVARKTVIVEIPVNSDIRITDPWRILFPSPRNLRLFFSIPRRARETLWQFDPFILMRSLGRIAPGFTHSLEKIFQVYHGVPSRCWRLISRRAD